MSKNCKKEFVAEPLSLPRPRFEGPSLRGNKLPTAKISGTIILPFSVVLMRAAVSEIARGSAQITIGAAPIKK
jgi:hypothetical protein